MGNIGFVTSRKTNNSKTRDADLNNPELQKTTEKYQKLLKKPEFLAAIKAKNDNRLPPCVILVQKMTNSDTTTRQHPAEEVVRAMKKKIDEFNKAQENADNPKNAEDDADENDTISNHTSLVPMNRLTIPGNLKHVPLVDYIVDSEDDDPSFFPKMMPASEFFGAYGLPENCRNVGYTIGTEPDEKQIQNLDFKIPVQYKKLETVDWNFFCCSFGYYLYK